MISLAHQCVFVHIPKCAGQSVETAFLNDLKLTWKQRAVLLLRPKTVCDPQGAPPKLAHLMADQYVGFNYMPAKLFKTYLRFSVIRNPWARVYSIYKYKTNQKLSFSDFVVKVFEKKFFNKLFWFAAPQVDYLSNQDGKLLVEHVVRLENAKEIEKIFHSLGFADLQLPYVNESKSKNKSNLSKNCQDVYCQQSYDLVRKLYAKDIDAFDYSF